MRFLANGRLKARASSVGTPTTGFPEARASPLTVLTPILKPVKLPGPRDIANPSTSFMVRLEFLSSNSMVSTSDLAWVTGQLKVYSASSSCSLIRATLSTCVAVSIARILIMIIELIQ